MNNIQVRYGSRLDMTGTTDDAAVVSIDFIVGKPGQVAKINETFLVTAMAFTIVLDGVDLSIPLGEYNYQINLNYATGSPKKLPDPAMCDIDDVGLPTFTVLEALDETEVTV